MTEFDEGFVGFLRLNCSAPECPCYVTALIDTVSLERGWEVMRIAATQSGWVCTPNAREEGPHYCACDHTKEGARAPR